MMTETYECIRPDKGFRFISEKVSHNPLIVAVRIPPLAFFIFIRSLIQMITFRHTLKLKSTSTGKAQRSKANSGASQW